MISKRLRYEILRRDGHRCKYCAATADDGVKLTVDHVVPTTLGGSDDPSNLVAACADCNSGKSATPPDAALIADVAGDALRWAAAMKQAAEIEAEQRNDAWELVEHFRCYWVSYSEGRSPNPAPVAGDWQASIERFHALGMTEDDIGGAVDTTFASSAAWPDLWRYFCGVMWAKLRDRQEMARKIIAGELVPRGA